MGIGWAQAGEAGTRGVRAASRQDDMMAAVDDYLGADQGGCGGQ